MAEETTTVPEETAPEETLTKIENTVDPQEIEDRVTKKAEAIASQKTDKLKEELIAGLAGNKPEAKYSWEKEGRKDPKSWDQLIEEMEGRLDRKLTEKEKARVKEKEDKAKQALNQERENHNKISRDWMELVENGNMPKLSPEVETKIKDGKTLTEDDKKDPGLVAYRNLVQLHKEKGEDSLYKTYYKHYSKKSSGANAPVFGRDQSSPDDRDEIDYTYEEVAGDRISKP